MKGKKILYLKWLNSKSKEDKIILGKSEVGRIVNINKNKR